MTEIVLILDATVRLSAPLLLAAMAALLSERAGILDIGLEGKVLAGAFAAATAATLSGSAWVGLAAAVSASILVSAIHASATVLYRGNQVVSGIALIFFVSGITGLLAETLFKQGGRTPQLPAEARFLDVILPGTEMFAAIPVAGPIWSELVSGHTLLVYFALLLVPVLTVFMNRTGPGLVLKSVGENPEAADSNGISVMRARLIALLFSGAIAGLAGANLSISQASGFLRDMTAGMGFVALAAVIFAKWRPVQTFLTCLLFGALDAVAIRLQGQSVFGLGELPGELMQIMPYVLTIVLLGLFVKSVVPPAALGKPFIRSK